VILGSQSFVESHFYSTISRISWVKDVGALPRLTALGGADTLWVFRDLRVRSIG
jgi:hypothetical protein